MEQLHAYDRFEPAESQMAGKEALETRMQEAAPVSDRAQGIHNVELSKINSTDIQSAHDFADPGKYAGMRREAEMLKQMEPALNQGADQDFINEVACG